MNGQMAYALEISNRGIVLHHMRHDERIFSDLSEFAGHHKKIRSTMNEQR